MLRGFHRCIDCAEEITRRYQIECQKIQNHQDGLDCFLKTGNKSCSCTVCIHTCGTTHNIYMYVYMYRISAVSYQKKVLCYAGSNVLQLAAFLRPFRLSFGFFKIILLTPPRLCTLALPLSYCTIQSQSLLVCHFQPINIIILI